jgi:hypothetical protein
MSYKKTLGSAVWREQLNDQTAGSVLLPMAVKTMTTKFGKEVKMT